MSSILFVDYQTVIPASWLNDVNALVYSGTVPATTFTLTNLVVNTSVSGSGFTAFMASPPAIGAVLANTGKFTSVQGTNITATTQFTGDGTGLTGLAPNLSIGGTALNVTGIVSISHGGTGLTSTPANGQIPIGNGTGFTLASITAGTNVTVTNSAGGITISAASGVTSVIAGAGISVAGTTAVTVSNTGVTSITAGTGISVSGSTGGITIANQISGARGQLFSANGTFTIPTGVTSIKVTVVGGGGGGSNGPNNAPDGGNSTVASGTQTISTITGGGGGGGYADGGHNGFPGAASGGDMNLPGCLGGAIGTLGGGTVLSPFSGGRDQATYTGASASTAGALGCGGGTWGSPQAFGGGAGTAIKYLTGMTPGNTLAITIGGGGSGTGSASSGGAGIVVIEW